MVVAGTESMQDGIGDEVGSWWVWQRQNSAVRAHEQCDVLYTMEVIVLVTDDI